MIDSVRRSREEMTTSERRRLTETIDSIRKTKLASSKPGSQIVTLRHNERKTRNLKNLKIYFLIRKNLLSSRSV